MRLQVDARSIAERARLDSVDSRIVAEAGGSFGVGSWGASAKMSTNVGFVHSDEQFSREEIAASAGLRSSVDIRFRTLPLDVTRMAPQRELQGIQARSMVPEREAELGSLLSPASERRTAQPQRPNPASGEQMLRANRQIERAEAARREAEERSGGESGGRGRSARGRSARGGSARGASDRGAGDRGASASERPRSRTERTGDRAERPRGATETPRGGAERPRSSTETPRGATERSGSRTESTRATTERAAS